MIDSGWNCTPSIGNDLWRIAIISSSAVHAEISKAIRRELFYSQRMISRCRERIIKTFKDSTAIMMHFQMF